MHKEKTMREKNYIKTSRMTIIKEEKFLNTIAHSTQRTVVSVS